MFEKGKSGNPLGRKPGMNSKVKIRKELHNAIGQVVKASSEGDITASIAVVKLAEMLEIHE